MRASRRWWLWAVLVWAVGGSATAAEAAPVGQTVAWSPVGDVVAWGRADETLVVDVGEMKVRHRLGESRGEHAVDFLSDGRLAIQGYSDNRSVLWDVASGNKLVILAGGVACGDNALGRWACSSPQRGYLVRMGWQRERWPMPARISLRRWDGAKLHTAELVPDPGSLNRPLVDLSPRGLLVMGGKKPYSRIEHEDALVPMQTSDPKVTAHGYERRPKLLSGGFVRIYQWRAGVSGPGRASFVCELARMEEDVVALGLGQRKDQVLAGGHLGGLVLLSDRCQVLAKTSAQAPVEDVALSFDGRRAASVHKGDRLCVWDIDDRAGLVKASCVVAGSF